MMDELNSLEKKPRLDLKDNMEIMSSKVWNSIICLCMRSLFLNALNCFWVYNLVCSVKKLNCQIANLFCFSLKLSCNLKYFSRGLDLIWFDLIWFDLIWFDLIWFDLIWFDLIWFDLIWFDLTRQKRRYEFENKFFNCHIGHFSLIFRKLRKSCF